MRYCVTCASLLAKKPGPGKWPRYCSAACRRAAGRRPAREPVRCRQCGVVFEPARTGPVPNYCGASCKARAAEAASPERYARPYKIRRRICRSCGAEFLQSGRGPDASWCAACSRQGAITQGDRGIGPVPVCVRDGWRCGLCRRRIGKTYRYPHPRSASVDHIVPLSEGGEHRWTNVQAAHLRCNLLKRTRAMGEQLRLVG